jgi:hypothetical protein
VGLDYVGLDYLDAAGDEHEVAHDAHDALDGGEHEALDAGEHEVALDQLDATGRPAVSCSAASTIARRAWASYAMAF